MDQLGLIEMREGYAVARPSGDMPLHEAVRWVSRAIEEARTKNVRKLLVNVLELSGFEPPSIPDRYFMVREWVDAAQALVRVALVVQPHMIDPHRFGPTVAANRGFTADVFASEDVALAWLLSDERRARNTQDA